VTREYKYYKNVHVFNDILARRFKVGL